VRERVNSFLYAVYPYAFCTSQYAICEKINLTTDIVTDNRQGYGMVQEKLAEEKVAAEKVA
jgi:hypothetical protein